MSELPAIRRIVTGETPEGKSVFVIDRNVEPVLGRNIFYGVWGWDETPVLPWFSTEDYVPKSLYANPGGIRVTMIYFPPEGWEDTRLIDDQTVDRELLESLRQSVDTFQSYPELGPGFHRTDDVDIIFVINGEIGLVQHDDQEVLLRAGDCMVQHGAVHAWRTRPEGCLLAFVVVGSSRDGTA